MTSENVDLDTTPKIKPNLNVREKVKKESNEAILGLDSEELEIKNKLLFAEEENPLIKSDGGLIKIYVILTFIVAFSIFIFAASVNPSVFILDKGTAMILNQAVNAVVLLVIPFLFGALGGLSRLLLTDVRLKQKGTLIISAGLMAIFSWVAIKSDLLFSKSTTNYELDPLIQVSGIVGNSSFYSSCLIAIFVGILSTSFYISILRNVELQLAKSDSKYNDLLKEVEKR